MHVDALDGHPQALELGFDAGGLCRFRYLGLRLAALGEGRLGCRDGRGRLEPRLRELRCQSVEPRLETRAFRHPRSDGTGCLLREAFRAARHGGDPRLEVGAKRIGEIRRRVALGPLGDLFDPGVQCIEPSDDVVDPMLELGVVGRASHVLLHRSAECVQGLARVARKSSGQ